MNKIQLKFGQTEAQNVDVYILVKNNEKYLPHFFQNMINIEKKYDVNLRYYILENDSVDRSLELIKYFLKNRDGLIIYPGNSIRFNDLNRLKRMELLRNTLVNSNNEKKSEWSLVVDSDVYFEPETIERLFRADPKAKKIGMLCAYGVEFHGEYSKTIQTQNHYYDTYTYIDENKALYWPHCIFNNCEKCRDKIDHKFKRDPTGLLEVVSAFGGLAIIDTTALKNSDVKWAAIPNGNIVMCEHIGLCLNIKRNMNLAVAIDCDTKVFWEVPS
jgi:GT2 family glycosyltransferase